MSIPHKNGKKRKKALGCIQLALTVASAVFAAEMPLSRFLVSQNTFFWSDHHVPQWS
jgi:hypothetical protein